MSKQWNFGTTENEWGHVYGHSNPVNGWRKMPARPQKYPRGNECAWPEFLGHKRRLVLISADRAPRSLYLDLGSAPASVSCGLAKGMALVLAAQNQACLGIDSNAFPIAPVVIVAVAALYGVAHVPERVERLSRKARLHIHHIRQVLLVKARSIHRLLDIQTTIRRAQKDVGNRGDNARSARGTDHEANLVILQHNDGRHAGQRTLLRSNRICRTLHQPKHIRRAHLGGKVVHLIIQQDS